MAFQPHTRVRTIFLSTLGFAIIALSLIVLMTSCGPLSDPLLNGDRQPLTRSDRDNDGLFDDVETILGTDPDDEDSDGDGILDGADSDSGDLSNLNPNDQPPYLQGLMGMLSGGFNSAIFGTSGSDASWSISGEQFGNRSCATMQFHYYVSFVHEGEPATIEFCSPIVNNSFGSNDPTTLTSGQQYTFQWDGSVPVDINSGNGVPEEGIPGRADYKLLVQALEVRFTLTNPVVAGACAQGNYYANIDVSGMGENSTQIVNWPRAGLDCNNPANRGAGGRWRRGF